MTQTTAAACTTDAGKERSSELPSPGRCSGSRHRNQGCERLTREGRDLRSLIPSIRRSWARQPSGRGEEVEG